jgi:hypothetical protein
MRYIDYIELGFTRENLKDEVEFKNTGYHGFILYKKLDGSNDVTIQVYGSELDKPKLYIPRTDETSYSICISEDDVHRLC